MSVELVLRNNEYYVKNLGNYPFMKKIAEFNGLFTGVSVEESDVMKAREVLGTDYFYSFPTVLSLCDRFSLEAAGITQVREQPLLDLDGRGTLVALIDTGIDYTNERFLYENGSTRVVSIYDQTAEGSPPEGFPFGSEFSRSEINSALGSDDPFSVVPSRDLDGHGTFLASIAAGRGQSESSGAAPASELIIVKLRNAGQYLKSEYLVPERKENVFDSFSVMLGVEYVLRKARELNRPVSICIGLSTNFGPHDGSGIFEEYLDSASGISGTCVSVAAGNECRTRRHAKILLEDANDEKDVGVRSPDSSSSLFITLLTSYADRVSVSLTSPTGERVGRIPVKNGSVYSTGLVFEKSTVQVEYYYPLTESTSQATVIKIKNATQGVWTVTVRGDIVTGGEVDVYLPTQGTGHDGTEFLSPDPYGTVTVPATSKSPVSCGAYDARDGSVYIESSWGDPAEKRRLPDLAAPGVRVGGSFPFSEGEMSGTSVSSAITCGAAALMLQWGIVEGNYPSLNTHQIKGFLIRSCVRDPLLDYPDPQWGYGKLDLYRAFEQMRNM